MPGYYRTATGGPIGVDAGTLWSGVDPDLANSLARLDAVVEADATLPLPAPTTASPSPGH